MQTYKPKCCDTIDHVSRVLVEMANLTKDSTKACFNGIVITAKPGDNADTIAQFYNAELDRRYEVYINSPEYKERERRAEEKRQLHELALKASPEKMTLRDEAVWKKYIEANTDLCGVGIIRFVERWARLMEGRMARGDILEKCAEETSHLANDEGITGFMYGRAVSILSQVWVHGEQLRRWHNKNTQLGTEGDEANENGGVLNPATLGSRQ